MSRDWTPEEYYYVQKATDYSCVDMMENMRIINEGKARKMYNNATISKHRQFELFGNLINNFESLYDRASEIPEGFEKLKELERQLQQFIDTGEGDDGSYLIKWFHGRLECVGFCEIDEHAKAAYEALYDTEGELYFNDARKINPNELPDIDLICGGFPCQSFSVAGKRRGFADDTRGTLFFEIARIAAIKRPQFLFLENVPGLLSHDKGRTFATILSTLDELGYDVAWQVCNSANFGVPQSRSRLFIIGSQGANH